MHNNTKNIKVNISYSVFLFFALSLWAGEAKTYFLFFVSAILHEYIHMITAMLFKIEVFSINIFPWGLKLTTGILCGAKGKTVLMAGPFGSLLIALLCYFTNNFPLCQVNIALFLFNLIPALPLDGGRLLFLCSKNKSLTKNISFVCGSVLALLSPFSFWFIPVSLMIFSTLYRDSINLFDTEIIKTLEKSKKNVYNIKK